MSFRISKTRSVAMSALIAGTALLVGVLAVEPAAAVPSLSMDGNATLPKGGSRYVGATWGDQGPYKVNFYSNVPGGPSWTTGSTTTTNHFLKVAYSACTTGNFAATHTISVWMKAGAGARVSGSSTTTWTGNAC